MTFQTKTAARQFIKAQWPGYDWATISHACRLHLPAALLAARQKLTSCEGNLPSLLAYMPIYGEVDLTPAYDLLRKTYTLWLPKVEGNNLMAGRYQVVNQLIKGPFNILEPPPPYVADWASLCPLILLIPCLAINPQGYRLGRGKGYYDRLLHSLKDHPHTSIGVCPAAVTGHSAPPFQPDEWDMPLHGWLNETHFSLF